MLSSRSVDEQVSAPRTAEASLVVTPPPSSCRPSRPPPPPPPHRLTHSVHVAGVASRHRRTSGRRHTPDRRARRAARRRGDDGTRPDLAREGVGCVRARAVSARPGARARCVRPALPPTGACVPSPCALYIIPSLLAAHASNTPHASIARASQWELLESPPSDPSALSFWLGARLPLTHGLRAGMLACADPLKRLLDATDVMRLLLAPAHADQTTQRCAHVDPPSVCSLPYGNPPRTARPSHSLMNLF